MRKQFERLQQWAEATGHLIAYCPPAGAPTSRGAEHEVFFDKANNRVFKRTHPGTSGSIRTKKGIRRNATPYFYLRRLDLVNHVFWVRFATGRCLNRRSTVHYHIARVGAPGRPAKPG